MSIIPLLILLALTGYIWLQYRSCYQPQSEVRIERIRDTVRTIKEIPLYYHIKDTVISERFIDRIFKPEIERIPVREEIVQITEDSLMRQEGEFFGRNLIYYIATEHDTVFAYTVNFLKNDVRIFAYPAPKGFRETHFVTTTQNPKFYFETEPFIQWKGLNVEVQYWHLPEPFLSTYLWTGFQFGTHLSTDIFVGLPLGKVTPIEISGLKPQLGLRVNYRL